MHLTSKKFKNLIPLTLLFPVLYVVLASSDLLIFHTNDDPAVIAIMKGTLAEPDYHVKPVHSILGYVFMCLYSWKPDFFWYDLFMVSFYCLGITRILIIFSVHNRLYFPISLLLLTSILVGFLPFQPNFTFLSFLLTFAAIFPFIVNDKREFLGFTNRNVFFSFLMLFIACLYRDLSAFIMTGCAFLVYMSLAVSEHKKKKSTEIFLKIFSKRAFILIGMVGFTLFMHFVNIYSHRIIPEYDRYVEYDKYRSGIADFNNYRYNKTFEELGISLNDYYLMRNFWGIDAPPLHLENLRRLKPVVIYEYWRIRNGLMTTFHTMKYKSSLIILSILVLISFYFYQTWIISGVCLASIVAVATYTSRMGLRVFLPIMALALITSIFFHGSDLLKGGQPKRILVYFCCVLIFFSAIVWTRHVQYFLINL